MRKVTVLGWVWIPLLLRRNFPVLLLLTYKSQDFNIKPDSFIHFATQCVVLRAENPCVNHEIYAAWGPCQGCVHVPFSELITVSKDNLFSFPYFSSHSMGRNTKWNENQELRSVRASQILPTTQASSSIKILCFKPFKAQVLPICFVICPQIHCTNMISTKIPWKQTRNR